MTKYIPETNTELLIEHIGVGVHTGLRKGTSAPDAPDLWKAIADSETDAWWDACAWALSGLHRMGYEICRVEEE